MIIADRFAKTEKRIKNGKAFAGSFPVVRYCLLRLPLFLTVKNKMMITPIQCATMHSGLTEQEIKEKYGWVLRALSEYGSRCVYDFLDGNSPEPAKHKPFIVGNVRDILDELKQEEITFGLFVEKLNAIASKFYEKPSEGASEGISKIREVMNWISQCVDEDHDLEVSEIKMIWNDLSDAISLIESTPHSSEGMAEALRLKWINLTEDMGRLLSGQRGVSIDKLNKAMNLVQDFVNTMPASLSPGVEDNQTKKQ